MPAYDDGRFAPPAPVAAVTLRGLHDSAEIGDVPMLIDSGADATLVPRRLVASLGITATGERYQLLAFDGTTSESEVFLADLVFMGRRFRGRFLATDEEVGILGRDVLNHVRLLLDGPARSWEGAPPSSRGEA